MATIQLVSTQVNDIRIVNAMQLNIVEHVLFTKVYVEIHLLCEEAPNIVKHILVEGEEYNNWGFDDAYLINLIATKLGFELQ